MRELRNIVRAYESLEAGECAILATLVRVEGSTYRRPGARMLVLPYDRSIGLISGGCLEGALLERAQQVRASGRPQIAHYDSTADEDILWGLGLGCAGIVDVLIERIDRNYSGGLDFLTLCLRERRAGALVTVVSEGTPDAPLGLHWRRFAGDVLTPVAGGAGARPPWIDRWTHLLGEASTRVLVGERTEAVLLPGPAGPVELLIEYYPPAPRLMIFGAGPDAVPLVRLADELGWDPWVIDPRASFARPERFPEATHVIACKPGDVAAQIPLDRGVATVVMTHNYLHDREILRALLVSPVSYIGALGPKRRTEDLLAELREEGVAPTEERRETLFGPAGLDIGADSPEQIALAILAEVQAVWAGRPGGWLRDRKGPIHESRP